MTQDFRVAMQLHGLFPGDIAADGKWKRCPTEDKPRKKNGAYKLDVTGRRGWFMNYADGRGVQQWTNGEAYTPTPVDMRAIEEARQREREVRLKGIRDARRIFGEAGPFRGHRYLSAKGLSADGCARLKVWQGRQWLDRESYIDDEWLVVPIYSAEDKVVNLQLISGEGVKRFIKGAPVREGYFCAARQRPAITVFCEGLATGLALYQSMQHVRVVVAFNAGNLSPVVELLAPSLRGPVCIVADNDRETEKRIGANPGIVKGREAAALVGAGLTWFEDIEGTDAADALKEWGPAGRGRIERQVRAAAKFVVMETHKDGR